MAPWGMHEGSTPRHVKHHPVAPVPAELANRLTMASDVFSFGIMVRRTA